MFSRFWIGHMRLSPRCCFFCQSKSFGSGAVRQFLYSKLCYSAIKTWKLFFSGHFFSSYKRRSCIYRCPGRLKFAESQKYTFLLHATFFDCAPTVLSFFCEGGFKNELFLWGWFHDFWWQKFLLCQVGISIVWSLHRTNAEVLF